MHAGGSWWPLPEAIEHCAHVSAWFARLRTVANYAYGTLTLGRVFTEFVSKQFTAGPSACAAWTGLEVEEPGPLCSKTIGITPE